MQKLWVVYDSKWGNCKKVAEALGKLVEKDFDVHVEYAKRVKPAQVVADQPAAVFVGGPIRAAMPSFTIKGWAGSLGKALKKAGTRIPKALVFCTAGGTPENAVKLKAVLENSGQFDQIYPDTFGILVADLQGPIKPEEFPKIDAFGEPLRAFLAK
jgi:flavorubredoxin